MDAGADGLRECFLGREALGEVAHLVLHACEAWAFRRREDAIDEAIAEALQALLDTLDGTDIGHDPHDHFVLAPCPSSLAAAINAFISRTASRMPTNTARLTMACPMCSSRTPGNAAMAFTFA